MRSQRYRRKQSPGVNLTPLLDAVFLIIVLLLCSFLHMRVVQAVKVERPVASHGTKSVGNGSLIEVTVTADGRIFLDGMEVALGQLRAVLPQRAENAEGCLISADRAALHGRVTEVLLEVKGALGNLPAYFETAADNVHASNKEARQ